MSIGIGLHCWYCEHGPCNGECERDKETSDKKPDAKKHYLLNDLDISTVSEGDIIRFEMSSFTSGEYLAEVMNDEVGLFIDKENNWFKGCRDYDIIKPADKHYQQFKELL